MLPNGQPPDRARPSLCINRSSHRNVRLPPADWLSGRRSKDLSDPGRPLRLSCCFAQTSPAIDYRRSSASGRHTTGKGIWSATRGFQWAALVLPDGIWVRFERTSSGSSYGNAMYEHRDSASEWYGAQLGWTGLDWALRRRDGLLMRFNGCGEGGLTTCSIVMERDADGHVIRYQRDKAGRLLRMETTPARWIAFDYDDDGRIVRAFSSSSEHVRYDYDDRGRLSDVTANDGRRHHYGYSALDEMTRIEDPGVVIENSYDANNRCIKQVNTYPSPHRSFEFSYLLNGDTVVETNEARSDGTWTRYNGTRRNIEHLDMGSHRPPLGDLHVRTRSLHSHRHRHDTDLPQHGGLSTISHWSRVRNGDEERTKRNLLRTNCSWESADWQQPN